jgi:ParB family transcriptional regulator, chromosome partitioning protein
MTFRTSKDDDWDTIEEPRGLDEAKQISKPKRPILVNIDDIELGNAGRKIDHRKVKQLERSIEDQGLRFPIHVYKLYGPHAGKYGLAAGQHRLHAVRNLGYRTVPAVIIRRKQAKAWRAAENLYRNDLSMLEKSLAIVEYAKEREHLPNVKAEVTKGGKQPHDKGYSKLAKAVGYHRDRVAEAYAHASLPKSIQKAILARRKLNTRATLNRLVEIETEEDQLRFVRARSQAEPSKTKPEVKIGKPTPSKPQKKKWKNSMAVAALKNKWKATPFRSFYEAQPAGARKEFVRQVMN